MDTSLHRKEPIYRKRRSLWSTQAWKGNNYPKSKQIRNQTGAKIWTFHLSSRTFTTGSPYSLTFFRPDLTDVLVSLLGRASIMTRTHVELVITWI